MLRFKTFQASDAATVESRINKWLMEGEPDIKVMEQSIDTSGALVVSFLYDEGFMATEQRLSVEASEIVDKALSEQPVLEPIEVDQEQV